MRCRLTVCSIAFGLFPAASLPFIYSLYFWLLRYRLYLHFTVYISGYFLAVCFIFLATAMLFVIVVSLLDQICGCYIRCYVSPVIGDAWVHAYINVQHICTLIRRVGPAGGPLRAKERALQAKVCTRV